MGDKKKKKRDKEAAPGHIARTICGAVQSLSFEKEAGEKDVTVMAMPASTGQAHPVTNVPLKSGMGSGGGRKERERHPSMCSPGEIEKD